MQYFKIFIWSIFGLGAVVAFEHSLESSNTITNPLVIIGTVYLCFMFLHFVLDRLNLILNRLFETPEKKALRKAKLKLEKEEAKSKKRRDYIAKLVKRAGVFSTANDILKFFEVSDTLSISPQSPLFHKKLRIQKEEEVTGKQTKIETKIYLDDEIVFQQRTNIREFEESYAGNLATTTPDGKGGYVHTPATSGGSFTSSDREDFIVIFHTGTWVKALRDWRKIAQEHYDKKLRAQELSDLQRKTSEARNKYKENYTI